MKRTEKTYLKINFFVFFAKSMQARFSAKQWIPNALDVSIFLSKNLQHAVLTGEISNKLEAPKRD